MTMISRCQRCNLPFTHFTEEEAQEERDRLTDNGRVWNNAIQEALDSISVISDECLDGVCS